MDTKELTERLKAKTSQPAYVIYRQALVYYLYRNGISMCMTSKVLNRPRRKMYNYIYRMRDLLEVNDKLAREAYDEIANHNINIRPVYIDGQIITKHAGYKLLIDNQIY